LNSLEYNGDEKWRRSALCSRGVRDDSQLGLQFGVHCILRARCPANHSCWSGLRAFGRRLRSWVI